MVVMVALDSKVSTELNEKAELELDDLELEREWAEAVESGEMDRAGGLGNLSMMGVIQVGAETSSAIMAKIWSSSASSSSKSC